MVLHLWNVIWGCWSRIIPNGGTNESRPAWKVPNAWDHRTILPPKQTGKTNYVWFTPSGSSWWISPNIQLLKDDHPHRWTIRIISSQRKKDGKGVNLNLLVNSEFHILKFDCSVFLLIHNNSFQWFNPWEFLGETRFRHPIRTTSLGHWEKIFSSSGARSQIRCRKRKRSMAVMTTSPWRVCNLAGTGLIKNGVDENCVPLHKAYGGFHKFGYPEIIHFKGGFPL